jgi:hypothetical protein
MFADLPLTRNFPKEETHMDDSCPISVVSENQW